MSFNLNNIVTHFNKKVSTALTKDDRSYVDVVHLANEDGLAFRTSYIIRKKDFLIAKSQFDPLIIAIEATKNSILDTEMFKYEKRDLLDYDKLLQQQKSQYDGLSQL